MEPTILLLWVRLVAWIIEKGGTKWKGSTFRRGRERIGYARGQVDQVDLTFDVVGAGKVGRLWLKSEFAG